MDTTTVALVIGVILAVACFIAAPFIKNSQAQKRWEETHVSIAEAMRQQREQEKIARTIVEVKLLDGGSTTYKRGGLGGAAFGGFIGGAPGAIIGAVLPSGKGTQKQKFAVKYGDGSVMIRECEPGSSEYKELMKHVKWEEIQ